MLDYYHRFWAKVHILSPIECWEWQSGKDPNGYGRFGIGPDRSNITPRLAHRVAWELAVGPIPEGRHLCHHCDNPGCVNPAHLFIGTAGDNMRDMARKGRNSNQNIGKTHCPKNHPYAGNNLYVTSDGKRQCKECVRFNLKASRARKKELLSSGNF